MPIHDHIYYDVIVLLSLLLMYVSQVDVKVKRVLMAMCTVCDADDITVLSLQMIYDVSTVNL